MQERLFRIRPARGMIGVPPAGSNTTAPSLSPIPSLPLDTRTMSAPTAFDDTLDQFLEKHPTQSEAEYLLAWEERWNKRIDKDVAVLGEGLGKMVDAFEVRFFLPFSVSGLTGEDADEGWKHALGPAGHATETAHLQAQLLSSTVLNSATSLLSLTHQLKLMVLLPDTKTVGANQEKEKQELERQVDGLRKDVSEAVGRIAQDEQR